MSNARGSPRGRLMPSPQDRQLEQMPRGCPGWGGGGWAPLELIDVLAGNASTFCWLHSFMDLCSRWLWYIFVTLQTLFNQWDFWNVVKKVLFLTKVPVVNLYSSTPLTRVGLLQFPLVWPKKFSHYSKSSLWLSTKCLQGERLFCYVQAIVGLLYNTIIRSDVTLTDWHMVWINLHVLWGFKIIQDTLKIIFYNVVIYV